MVGGATAPRTALEVNGNIGTTALYDAGAGYQWANLGGTTIMAKDSIYSYGYICTGNNSGGCGAANGVVLGNANTTANVNITNTGNSFFNVGNFGIGTNAPAAKLTIGNNVATGALDNFNEYQVLLFNGGTALTSYGMGVRGSTLVFNTAFNTDFDSNGATVLSIAGTNLGVGTTTPGAKLGVAGNILAQGTIRSGTGGYIFPDGTTQTTAATGQWTTSGSNIYSANAGNVGVGATAPLGKLQVGTTDDTAPSTVGAWDARHFVVGQTGNTGGVGISYNNTTGYGVINALSPSVAWRNLVLQSGGGNVGIGGTPTSRLQVFGDTTLQGTAGTSYFSSGAYNYIRGSTYAFNGPWYDESNSAYYVDPSNVSIFNDLRSNILYDQADTTYYVDPGSTSVINALQVGKTSTTYANVNFANNVTTHSIFNNTDGTFYLGAGRDSGNVKKNIALYNLSCAGGCNVPNIYLYGDTTAMTGAATVGTTLNTGGAITAGGIIRSTSGGFQFPDGTVQTTASTGLTGAVRTDVAGDWNIASNSADSAYNTAAFEIREANFAGAGTGAPSEAPRIGFHWGGRVASQIGMDASGVIRTYDNPGTGYAAFAAAGIRSYSGGFTFPDGTTQTTAATAVVPGNFIQNQFAAAQSASGWITGTLQAGTVSTNAGSHLSYSGTTNYLRGNTYANGVYYDENNSAYYMNGDGTSIFNDLRSNILYDNNDTGYYVDPNSTTNINVLGLNGPINKIQGITPPNGAIRLTPNLHLNSGTGNAVILNWDNGTTGNTQTLRIGNGASADVFYVMANGNSTQTGTATINGGIADTAGTRMDSGGGWFRTYGSTGWYNVTYNGGWNMSDATWIRSYGSKSVYVDQNIRTDGTLQVGGGGATLSVPNGGNTAVGYGLTVATTGVFGGNVTAPAFIYSSDRNLKENIVPLQSSLDKVRSLQGYTFDWKKDGRGDIGIIAQEVEKVFPELVHTDSVTGLRSVEYGNLVAPLIEAVKELANKFDALAARVFNTETRQTELEKQNQEQQAQIDALQKQITELSKKTK